MTTDTRSKIVSFIKAHGQARPKELSDVLKFGGVAVHRQLKKLVELGMIEKIGRAPKVFYILVRRSD